MAGPRKTGDDAQPGIVETAKILASPHPPPDTKRWHIERSIPIGFIAVIGAQTLIAAMFVGSLYSEVRNNTDRLKAMEASRASDYANVQPLLERFYKSEVTMVQLGRLVDALEKRIERNEEFRRKDQAQ